MFLTDLWIILPDWLFYGLLRLIGVDRETAHEWLCESWGCRCDQR